jgi:hypothetical protein
VIQSMPAAIFRSPRELCSPENSLTSLQPFRSRTPREMEIQRYCSKHHEGSDGPRRSAKAPPRFKQPDPPHLSKIPSLPTNFDRENRFWTAVKRVSS